MGDIVPVSTSGALISGSKGPETEREEYEKRIEEAKVHEEKLRRINEEIPTRIYNVVGSCAGAGSGDFHYYRQIRRAEQDRIRRLDAEAKKEEEVETFKAKQEQAQAEIEARTSKKRLKRQKKKEKKKQKKTAQAQDGQAGEEGQAAADGNDGSSSEDDGAVPQADLD